MIFIYIIKIILGLFFGFLFFVTAVQLFRDCYSLIMHKKIQLVHDDYDATAIETLLLMRDNKKIIRLLSKRFFLMVCFGIACGVVMIIIMPIP